MSSQPSILRGASGLLAAAALLFVLGACGGDDADVVSATLAVAPTTAPASTPEATRPPATTPPTTAPTVAPTQPPAAQGSAEDRAYVLGICKASTALTADITAKLTADPSLLAGGPNLITAITKAMTDFAAAAAILKPPADFKAAHDEYAVKAAGAIAQMQAGKITDLTALAAYLQVSGPGVAAARPAATRLSAISGSAPECAAVGGAAIFATS